MPVLPDPEGAKFSPGAVGELARGEFEKGFLERDTKGFWVGGATPVGVGDGEGSVIVIPTVSMVTGGSSFPDFEQRGSNSETLL